MVYETNSEWGPIYYKVPITAHVLPEASEAICGRTKGQQVHKETWWWNEEVGKAVEEKREWHRIWSKSKTEAKQPYDTSSFDSIFLKRFATFFNS